ncbi:MAG: class I SAM-dependent methyltransferase [bacterium]
MLKTDAGDPIFYHYVPLVGYVFKKRLMNTLDLLGKSYKNLLEIGFGSGILLPELSRRSQNLFGIDIHEKIPDVEAMLAKMGVKAELLQGSVLELPYQDEFFDGVVAVSIFEHIFPNDLDKAFLEVKRVMQKSGKAVISFPVRNMITDFFFQTFGWSKKEWNPRAMHPSSHKDIIEAAKKHFRVEKMIIFPRWLPINFSWYCSILFLKENG